MLKGQNSLNENKYTPGAGVGASNIANRRAKIIRATNCDNSPQCGNFATRLHPYEQYVLGYWRKK